jgi:hypothetical protein
MIEGVLVFFKLPLAAKFLLCLGAVIRLGCAQGALAPNAFCKRAVFLSAEGYTLKRVRRKPEGGGPAMQSKSFWT